MSHLGGSSQATSANSCLGGTGLSSPTVWSAAWMPPSRSRGSRGAPAEWEERAIHSQL